MLSMAERTYLKPKMVDGPSSAFVVLEKSMAKICTHHRQNIIHIAGTWETNGKPELLRVCSGCGRLWRGRLVKGFFVIDLAKAVPLKPGQRWITVHPNGEDEKGIPVLIQENPDGTAHVIGGAGGKLNYLRLNRIKSPEEWKRAAEERTKKQRKEAMRQRLSQLSAAEREKEEEVQSDIKALREMKQAEYVQTVMEAHGIAPEEWKLPEKVLAAMPPKSRAMAERRHLRKMVKVADKLVDEAREDILAARDKVIQDAIGDLPGSDIMPEPEPSGRGLGYATAVSQKAAENGLTTRQTEIEKHDISWRHFLDAADGSVIRAAELEARVEALRGALAAVREPVRQAQKMGLLDVSIAPKAPAVEDVSKVLLAQKKYREAERKLTETSQEINERGVPKAAFVVAKEIGEITDEQAKDALADELEEQTRRVTASKLLDAAYEQIEAAPLREHVGVGHYDAINNASLSATHEPCPIDRVTADILGPAAAAELLVQHWRETMSAEELDALRTAIANYHVKSQVAIAEKALDDYNAAKREIDAIEVPVITGADSLLAAQVACDTKAEKLMGARRTLGTALGKLEGMAALVNAFEEGPINELRVSLGAISNQQAVAQARAMGLQTPELLDNEDTFDYRIDSDGVNKFLTVTAEGMAKLIAKKADPEFAAKSRTAMEIKRGDHDVDGWLPAGFVARPATTFDDPDERALMVSEPLRLSEGMDAAQVRAAVEDYIGGRLADGQDPESLRQDLLSAEFVSAYVPKALQGEGSGLYYNALRELGFFSYNQVENLTRDELEKRADEIVAKRRRELGEDAKLAALNSQSVPLNDETYEAVHRALAKLPQAVVVGKGIGELTAQDKNTLRDFFWKHMTTEKRPIAAETKRERAEAAARAEEVVGHQVNIFGEMEEVKRGPSEADIAGPEETAWDRYVKAMGSTDRAYESILDVVRGSFMGEFARELGRVTGTEFKSGTRRIANWDRHVLGLIPPEKQARLLGERAIEEKRRQAQVATRSGGKFAKEDAAGARRERAEKLMAAIKQSQMGLFKLGDAPLIERTTIGDRAEAQLMKVFPMVAANFDPKKPVEIPANISMSGKYIQQQRAIKLIESQKRLSLNLGVGSGKTPIALGAFTDLHAHGKVKRGIFVVPSVVQGQFGGECLRFTKPGAYRWFANPAATAEERRKAYADPGKHMVIVTHQAFRDDLCWALAQHKFGGDVDKANKWLRSSSESERKSAIAESCKALGWNFDYAAVDEGHDLLNRRGKPNSRMANAIDAFTFNTPYYVSMTADPVKNDASEAFDVLHKLDPERYNDPQAFHAKYGVDTVASAEALQRELEPYSYTGRIVSGVGAERKVQEHDLTPEQSTQYATVLKNYQLARKAAREGSVDVDAIKAMAPHAFDGLNAEQQTAKAQQLSRFLASVRDSALDRIINTGSVDRRIKDAPCAKVSNLIRYVQSKGDRPGVIFAHSLDSVKRIKRELDRAGIKVVSLTGENSSLEKEMARLKFQPGGGRRAEAQVIVCSDAGAVGQNLQRGAWVYNYDTPDTAKTLEQRIGRIDRIGQTNPDVESIEAVSRTPYEGKRRQRIKRKSALREVFTAPTEMLDDTGLAHEIWTARQKQLQRDMVKAA